MDNSERIREFISKNKGVTEHKVAKYMIDNHYCARDTTHNLIYNSLIPNGKVIDKKVGNSFHKLYINEEDEFNIINQQLSGIENLIQAMDGPTRKYKLRYWNKEQKTFQTKPEGVLIYFWGYQAQIIQLLRMLLIRTSKLSLPEKDSQTLYTRIVKSMIKVDLQFWRLEGDLIEMTRHFHYENEPTPELKMMGVDAKLVSSLVTVIENFKKWYGYYK